MQFGFIPGKGTTDTIFTVRQMQEKYGYKRKKLYFAFVDLEKAFDKVPREVTRWALRKAGVDEFGKGSHGDVCAQTVIRTTVGDSKDLFLIPLLFSTVMEMISRELRAGLPLELLYANDILTIINLLS